MTDLQQQAQVRISCRDIDKESHFFLQLGFKPLQVFPADNPRMMLLLGHGLLLRMEKGLPVNDLTLILPSEDVTCSVENTQYSPSGVTVQFQRESLTQVPMPQSFEFSLNQFDAGHSWVTGRAGMMYRDLIPKRLAGAMIASNILIPEGGPVPDHVHYHDVQFQLIYCLEGWVKVVYEDQGAPFVLHAGDCVTQPPGIRHQVLEASDGLEVLEIGLPAEHMTTMDYDLSLPTAHHYPYRTYGSGDAAQTFCHHLHEKAQWQPWQQANLIRCQTRVVADSQGLAGVNVIRSTEAGGAAVEFKHHDGLRFYYLRSGDMKLTLTGCNEQPVSARDSFLLPAEQTILWQDFSENFELIEFIWK